MSTEYLEAIARKHELGHLEQYQRDNWPKLISALREAYNAGLDAAAAECGYVVEMYPATGADTEWSEGQICARAILALKGKL